MRAVLTDSALDNKKIRHRQLTQRFPGFDFILLLCPLKLTVLYFLFTSISYPRCSCDDPKPLLRRIMIIGRISVRTLCAFGYRISEVAWIHIDRKMIIAVHKHVIARIPRFSMSHDGQKTWMLNINGVRASDKGIYMCQVNTDPMISQVGYLQVVVLRTTKIHKYKKMVKNTRSILADV
ncbi:hypothetical protein QTP88_016103 [Uroleucon formosanum]